MLKSIMLPVDLAHEDMLNKSLDAAVSLAKLNKANLTLVGVTSSAPTDVAHNPEEFGDKLKAFGNQVAERGNVSVKTLSLVDVDVTADLGSVLIKAAEDMGADLIVMASHIPSFMEHIFASNAGYVANHAKCSVYVVR